jgi:hypothetical protein
LGIEVQIDWKLKKALALALVRLKRIDKNNNYATINDVILNDVILNDV